MDPVAARRRVAAIHRRRNIQIDEHNRRILGVVPPETDFVDGRRNAPLETVKLDGGVIVTTYQLLNDVIEWIETQLIFNSPYLTGEYAASHQLFADGSRVDPTNPPPAQKYTFISTLPYARKIERGLSPQAPEGVYEGVAALARARFGNIAYIRFTFEAVVEGGLQDYASVALGGRRAGKTATAAARAARQAHVEARFPAIVITPR
jgi:hypothetical protein